MFEIETSISVKNKSFPISVGTDPDINGRNAAGKLSFHLGTAPKLRNVNCERSPNSDGIDPTIQNFTRDRSSNQFTDQDETCQLRKECVPLNRALFLILLWTISRLFPNMEDHALGLRLNLIFQYFHLRSMFPRLSNSTPRWE